MLSPEEARSLTDEVKRDAETLWRKLVRLYKGQAHTALKYGSWGEYFESEFGGSRRHGYELLNAGKVLDAVRHGALEPPANERQARELVPLLKDEVALVETWRDLREKYGDALTAVDVRRVVSNRLERIKREEESGSRAREALTLATPPEIHVLNCNLRDLQLEPGSADLVFTDPPYPAEYLPEWEALARFAVTYLKRGRLLVAYSGQFHLPEVMASLHSELEYVWLGALVTPGAHNQVQRKHIRSAAKPLLFYSVGEYELGPWIDDAYVSEERAKTDHAWQQSVGAARYFIERLTKPGDLVVDPFLGSGTTAVACRDLGRRFVGCDVDEAAVGAAKLRLAA